MGSGGERVIAGQASSERDSSSIPAYAGLPAEGAGYRQCGRWLSLSEEDEGVCVVRGCVFFLLRIRNRGREYTENSG